MNSILQDYRELLSLTQTLILSEFTPTSSFPTDLETYDFFKQFTAHKQVNKGNSTFQIVQNQNPPKNFQAQAPVPQKANTPIEEIQKPEHLQVQKIAESLPPSSIYSKNKSQNSILKLEPITEPKQLDYNSLKVEFKNLFPNLVLQDSIPDDSEARKINQQWKNQSLSPQVILLFFDETPDQKAFLQKVTDAITQKLVPASLFSAYAIEKQNKWENMFKIQGVKLIIAPDYGIYLLPSLMHHYREFQRTLGGIPILLLTDISLYLKQPSLKAALWQAICSNFDKK